jgi:Glycogen recognition site of AMP-activated protein kinase/Glycosyl transferases group 1
MNGLRYAHPKCFWAAPDEFFTDGPLVNLGADFGVMPSLFEPGGIVQQEFFVAGTPVVAFKTGGLKDTVHEWQIDESEGNGFLFEDYNHEDFVMAMKRALRVFSAPPEYMALRRFAYMTTIDVSQVAWAWSSEFHRMRNAIYSREDVLHAEYSSRMRMEESKATSSGILEASARVVDLCWSTPVEAGDSVFVKGSWDDWAAEYKLKPVAAGGAVHATQLLLPRGEYTYKFRVGATWMHASDRPMRAAASTGDLMNNVLLVD